MKFGGPIDLQQNAINNAQLQNLSSAPGSPVNGQVYFDTTLHQQGCWSGTAWIYSGVSGVSSVTSDDGSIVVNTAAGTVNIETGTLDAIATAQPPTAAVAMNAQKITGLANGSSAQDAAAFGQLPVLAAADTSIVVGGTVVAPTVRTNTLDVIATQHPAAADWDNNGHKITGGATPTGANDFAIKSYVDAVASGLSIKASCRFATTGAETFTVTAGSVTQIAGTALDGGAPAVGDRILIKDAPAATGVGSVNSSQPGNGIYTVTNATTNLTVARAVDQTTAELPAGNFTFVEAGTANGSSGWVVSSPSSGAAFTFGTTAMQWTQFSGAGEITVVGPIVKTGNQLSLTTVPIAQGGTNATTAGTARDGTHLGTATAPTSGSGGVVSAIAEGIPTKVMALIGDGSTTSFTITHNLNTNDVVVAITAHATPWNAIIVDWSSPTSNTIVVGPFGTPPSAGQYNVVIIG